jgi:hypothetical protein
MRSTMWRLMSGAGLLSALALAGTMTLNPMPQVHAGQHGEAVEHNSTSPKLEGTWRVKVTLRNCQTGAELRPATPAMLTFAEGGTLTETTTVFPPAVRSPGHGFWRRSGWRRYTAVSEAFLFNPSVPAASAWIGTQRITQTIQFGYDPDELYSTATTEFFGPDGNPIPGFPPTPSCATAVAWRME